mgnify:CR=1 FL=1
MTIQPMVIRSAVSQIFASMIPVKRWSSRKDMIFSYYRCAVTLEEIPQKSCGAMQEFANFFINSEKLKNCDFRDVLYYCDCC